eukprot:UN04847
MQPYIRRYWGNPSSSHTYGQAAKQGVNIARSQVAGLFHCQDSEVVLMSGGTETINYAIKGGALSTNKR